MKKFYLLLCLAFLSIASIGQQLLSEPFNYTADPTNGLFNQSAGTWQRINTGDSILVAAGSLSYPGLEVSTGNKAKFDGTGADYYQSFTTQNSGSVYRSFILNVAALGGLTASPGGYFTSFVDGTTTTTFGSVVWLRLSATAGKYNIGISTRSSGSTISWLPTDLNPGTSYFVVASYDMVAGTANDVARLWLNPTAFDAPAAPAADATAASPTTDMTSVGKILLRQDNATNTPFIELDEYRVGTTWASVTPPSVVAPSPVLSAGSLGSFGSVCINTTSAPASFTITGADLAAGNITVGPLAGFSFATSSGGVYTSDLTLPQGGGAYSQEVFVKFNPAAVQSYDGNIPVSGGGATAINVAATASGVNTAPSVTTGVVNNITSTSADAQGTISSDGCSAVMAYGIEYSTTSGFANGTGTQVASSNLAGSGFSSSLSGLNVGTTYYYKAYATNAGGTGYGTEQSFTTAAVSPTISTTALASFGNVCINTTAVNSFTINGSNLTNADVVVGPLAGYLFATSSVGIFTNSLTLMQSGGTFSQEIFVTFNPAAVQSYSGNIPVSGGGAGNINVAATGSGVNSAPTVTTGASSAVTHNAATLAGTIAANGCSNITAYGIEFSTTSGFVNGTQVASGNLAGNNFTVNLTGLNPGTTYYYKAFAMNAGGTAYGTEQSFTTAAPPPPALSASALAAFGDVCWGDSSVARTFTITGSNLTNANIVVSPFGNYRFSTTQNGAYTNSLSITQAGGNFNQVIYVKLFGTVTQAHNGNIQVSGGGAPAVNVPVTGTVVNTPPVVTTNNATNITTQSATLNGRVGTTGCINTQDYGFEISTINNFTPGTGTTVSAGSVIANADYSHQVNNLVPNTTYYYRAFARSGAIGNGALMSFTTAAIPAPFMVYPSPVNRGRDLRITMNGLRPGYYGIVLYSNTGQKVYQKNLNIQTTYINETLMVPHALTPGVYRISIINNTDVLETRSVMILR
jgi:hypothetical protein